MALVRLSSVSLLIISIPFVWFFWFRFHLFCGFCLVSINNIFIKYFCCLRDKREPTYQPSWLHRGDVFLIVSTMLQVRFKWNTQRRLGITSPQCHGGTLWRRFKNTQQRLTIGTFPRCFKIVSNKTSPNDVSVVLCHNV